MTTLVIPIASGGDDGYQVGAGTPSLSGSPLQAGNNSGNSIISGFRFQVPLPQGQVIASATLTIKGAITYSTSATISVIGACQAGDSAAALAASANNFGTGTRPRTTAKSAAWDLRTIVAETDYSLNVTTSVQEVLSRAAWANNNYLAVLLDNNGSAASEWQEFYTYDGAPAKAAKLTIVYTSGGTDAVPPRARLVGNRSRRLAAEWN